MFHSTVFIAPLFRAVKKPQSLISHNVHFSCDGKCEPRGIKHSTGKANTFRFGDLSLRENGNKHLQTCPAGTIMDSLFYMSGIVHALYQSTFIAVPCIVNTKGTLLLRTLKLERCSGGA